MKIMKALALGLLIALATVSCSGTQVQNEQMANVAIELAGFNLGYFVGKDAPKADIAIRDAYLLARDGKLPPEEIAKAMAELKVGDPLLAGNLLIMLKAMGAGFSTDGQVIDIKGITPAMWEAAKSGYVQGFLIGQAKRG